MRQTLFPRTTWPRQRLPERLERAVQRDAAVNRVVSNLLFRRTHNHDSLKRQGPRLLLGSMPTPDSSSENGLAHSPDVSCR
jgi:hypothetical protein